MPEDIGLPSFAAEHRARRACRHCGRPLTQAMITSAGVVRHGPYPMVGFLYSTLCRCGGRSYAVVQSVLFIRQTADALLADCPWRELIVLEDPAPSEPELVTERQPLAGVTLLLRGRPIRQAHVFGGYAAADDEEDDDAGVEESPSASPWPPPSRRPATYLLCRWSPPPYRRPMDVVMRLESANRVRVAQLPPAEKVLPDSWDRFLDLPEGGEFTLGGGGGGGGGVDDVSSGGGGRRWRKLTRAELEPLVRDRLYRLAAYQSSRPKAIEQEEQ